MLYVMIVLGLTMGMQPIVGYNFGALKHERVKATLKLSILTGVCITSSGFIICELFPHAVSAVFTSDEHLIDMASHGVRICIAIFPFVGAQIVIGNFAKLAVYSHFNNNHVSVKKHLYTSLFHKRRKSTAHDIRRVDVPDLQTNAIRNLSPKNPSSLCTLHTFLQVHTDL